MAPSRRTILKTTTGAAIALSGCLSTFRNEPTPTPFASNAVQWSQHLGAVVGRPLVRDGTLYVAGGTNDRGQQPNEAVQTPWGENLYAFDTDGTERWVYETEANVRSHVAYFDGGLHTVVGWSAEFSGLANRLTRIEAGERQWEAGRTNDWLHLLGHTTENAYLGTSHDAVSTSGESLLAVDSAGDTRWQIKAGTTTEGVVSGGLLLCNSGGGAAAVGIDDGTVRWQRPAEFVGHPHVFDTTCYFRSSTQDADGNYRLVAVDATTGESKWSYANEISPAPFYPVGVTADSEHLYGSTTDGQVFALDSNDGGEYWQTTVEGEITGPPTVVDDHLYVTTREPSRTLAVAVASGEPLWTRGEPGRPHMIDANQQNILIRSDSESRTTLELRSPAGAPRWSFETSGVGARSVLVGNRAYVGTESGYLLALE